MRGQEHSGRWGGESLSRRCAVLLYFAEHGFRSFSQVWGGGGWGGRHDSFQPF